METKMYLNTETFPELAYLKTGVGPALILLHGFPESGSLWRNIWPSMAASFTVIIPDIPGSGESTFTGEQITMEQLATGIKQVMDKENIQEAVLVGHSMGGYIAFAFADLYPAYVKGLKIGRAHV